MRSYGRLFTATTTIAAPFPVPICIWSIPFNVTIYPCRDDSVIVAVYGLNQSTFGIGNISSVSPDGKRLADRLSVQLADVKIRVFPRSASWAEGRDNMIKFPPFYEVTVTASKILGIKAFGMPAKGMIGDWLKLYAQGKKSWRTISNKVNQGWKDQIILWNDSLKERRSCILSSGANRLKTSCWICSLGTRIQGMRRAMLTVSVSNETLTHSKILKHDTAMSPLVHKYEPVSVRRMP